ncbi:DUF6265 family protein [Taibaiella chishuiensis]|uniref:DUF6265 domain-containing protein n=1 Tax=Taibaiella chishuiensis TaxID=1434707 RepID=A0A2P8DD64_9BACT|nr:DUF6265 family protein [Taibaiella chishuiensis]PSK95135.1 hypothetical protein B0I18_1011299 [Taibaiella chishuiensis]
MKKQILVVCLLMASAKFATAQKWTREDFRALRATRGIWIADLSKDKQYLEIWTPKNDTLMEGRSFYINKDKKQELAETVQLVYSSGAIRYIVTTAGQNDEEPVAFTLIKKEKRTFTFENEQHDFPQQIIYRFPKNNTMKATISGKTPQGPRNLDFNFVKVTGRKFER